MIYICPTCEREFNTEEEVSKHFLKCWKDNNPHHISKPAPRSENISVSEASQEIFEFFALLKGEEHNERSNG